MSAAFRSRLSLAASCIAAMLSGTTPALAATPLPVAQVMVVGTYHFSNPGKDLANVQADDVLRPQRQAELETLSQSLAAFAPGFVAVEWPQDVADQRYAKFLAGTLEQSRNEVVQLGFRLAKQQGLGRVHGIDADGDFPFEPVQAWAQKHGQGERLAALLAKAQSTTVRINQLQKTASIGAVLHEMNTPAAIEAAQDFYAEALKFGAGYEQPGAALNGAWATRNYTICAKLLQALKPGDRAVVFYGQGHVHALRRCVIEAPGMELVDAAKYLH